MTRVTCWFWPSASDVYSDQMVSEMIDGSLQRISMSISELSTRPSPS